MSNLAMAAHHHKHHHGHPGPNAPGLKLPHLKMPDLSHLMAVAQGSQGPGPQHMLWAGLALLAVLIFIAVRKMRRS